MEHLTIKQAAKKLKVSEETLRRWDRSGKLVAERHPVNNYRIYRQEVLDLFYNDLRNETNYHKDSFEPIFQTDLGKLFNVDVVEFLRLIRSSTVDLIFADPPYNIKKAEWDSFQSQKEYVIWSLRWIKEAKRILKPNGTLYICGFSEILADIKWAASSLFTGCKWIVWYYRNKANLRNDWGRSHESILHFRKSKNFKFNIDEVRIPYNQHTLKYPIHPQATSSQYSNGKYKKYKWKPHPNGAKPRDVFEIPTIANNSWEKYKHPTQKPVELLRRIILSSSNKGDLVVDPFGGSGTTYAVCEAYERKWLGTEINKDYIEIIKDRLSDRNHIARIKDSRDAIESEIRRSKLRG